MTNTEKLVTWGLMALIAYELYKPATGTLKRSGYRPQITNFPPWVQQLSDNERELLVADWTNQGMSCQITDNLLSIPQGPGGACQWPVPEDYFSPTSGIFSACR